MKDSGQYRSGLVLHPTILNTAEYRQFELEGTDIASNCRKFRTTWTTTMEKIFSLAFTLHCQWVTAHISNKAMIHNTENAKWRWGKASKTSVHTKERTATESCARYRNDLDYSAWARTKQNLEQSGLEISRFCCIRSCVCMSVTARHEECTVLREAVFDCVTSILHYSVPVGPQWRREPL